MPGEHGRFKRRGAQISPPNRFERFHVEVDDAAAPADDDETAALRVLPTTYFRDDSQSIVSENDSPDVPFRYSVNPYRGCEHGCPYCYARPTHEYLGMNAGLDFETKIMVKEDAPRLLRAFLARDDWRCEPITMSGVTDCYQPIERKLRITRACLEVFLECRQPVRIITKNALVLRDLDLLTALSRRRLVHVTFAITTLNQELARAMEPRTSSPERRITAIGRLSAMGTPTSVLIAPVIPGLTDSEIPAILERAKAAGVRSAGHVLLRLPGAVRPIFLDWLRRQAPGAWERVVARIRSTRRGKLSESQFGVRMRGEGPIAEQVGRVFRLFAKKLGLDGGDPSLDVSGFRQPAPPDGQQRLF